MFVYKRVLILMSNAQDEERAVCDCLNPFDVIAVALARHLFFGALSILGDVPEVRGDIGGAGEEQDTAQACLGGVLSVSNRVDRLRFAVC